MNPRELAISAARDTFLANSSATFQNLFSNTMLAKSPKDVEEANEKARRGLSVALQTLEKAMKLANELPEVLK